MSQPIRTNSRYDSDMPTHEEIAQVIGVSRQRVYQIEREALAKLRAALEARGFKAEDFYDTEAT